MAGKISRLHLATATAVNALATLAPQILGLFYLSASDFGIFSAIYLTFALGASISFSIVSDPWVLYGKRNGLLASWSHYSAALSLPAMGAAIAAAILAFSLTTSPILAALGCAGAAAAVLRNGGRFFLGFYGSWGRIVLSDTLFLSGTILVWVAGRYVFESHLVTLLAAWTGGATLSMCALRKQHLPTIPRLRSWWRAHWTTAKPLLGESLLLDASSIGTPYIFLGLMPTSDFGVYRAVSNVAAPVRLALSPLRPIISTINATRALSAALNSAVLLAATSFGLLAYLALIFLGREDISFGVISSLVDYALPTSIYVAANFVAKYYYMLARYHATKAGIWRARLLQTTIAILGPIIGYALAGLSGAIWGYAVATSIFSIAWLILAFSSKGRVQ